MVNTVKPCQRGLEKGLPEFVQRGLIPQLILNLIDQFVQRLESKVALLAGKESVFLGMALSYSRFLVCPNGGIALLVGKESVFLGASLSLGRILTCLEGGIALLTNLKGRDHRTDREGCQQ